MEQMNTEEREFHFEAATLVGDIRDAMLSELKDSADGKPWNERAEVQQRAVVDRIHEAARGIVRKAVLLMSNKGFASLHGDLVQVQVKDGFKAVVKIPKGADFRHELVDSEGKEVVLVLASTEQFRGTRGAVPITAPAPLLDYADAAARVADEAEQGIVWWSADSPETTHADVGDVLSAAMIGHLFPHEIGRTGWLASRWAVRVPAADSGTDEFLFFDTEEEAAAHCASAVEEKAPIEPVPDDMQPTAASSPEKKSSRRNRKDAAAQPGDAPARDDGIVLEPQTTYAAVLEGSASFTVRTTSEGQGVIWHCWRDASGVVRGHEDYETAVAIARRMEGEDDAAWQTAEDRAKVAAS